MTTDEALRREIEMRAYYKCCERGNVPGGELDDWLAAEREVLAEQAGRATSSPGSVPDNVTSGPQRGRRRVRR